MQNFLSTLGKPVAVVTKQKAVPPLKEGYLHCTRWLINHVVAFSVLCITVLSFCWMLWF